MVDTDNQRARQWRDEVATAVLFHSEDRLTTHARVAAEREHRHLWVNTRTHHVRFTGSHRQLGGTGGTPAGRRRTAATAFQRQDEVKHTPSVAVTGDSSAVNRRRQQRRPDKAERTLTQLGNHAFQITQRQLRSPLRKQRRAANNRLRG